jgi:DNA repair exonuclease SbcCD ATPase subunit
VTEITVDDASTLFESLARETMKDHEKRFVDRIRSVKDACNTLESAASRFETGVRNAWGTMDKTASEYGTRMAQTIEEAARGLSRRQTSPEYDDVEAFHRESIEVLNTIVKTVRRYVPKLRRGLRVELAALNASLSKLEAAIRSLGMAIDQSPGEKIESVRRDVQLLKHAHEELVKLRNDRTEQSKALEATESEEKATIATTQEFDSNAMFRELARFKDELSAKEDEIAQFFQPMIKPLTKMERKESGEKSKTFDLTTLRDLVDRPVATVVTGQTYAIVQLLAQLDEELQRGSLEIEERRRRKAKEAIQQATQGAIEKLREDYLTNQANVQETLRQLRAEGLLDKRDEAEQHKAAIESKKQQLMSQMTEVNRRIDAISKTLLREKQSIEQQIRQVTGKEIKIQIED